MYNLTVCGTDDNNNIWVTPIWTNFCNYLRKNYSSPYNSIEGELNKFNATKGVGFKYWNRQIVFKTEEDATAFVLKFS